MQTMKMLRITGRAWALVCLVALSACGGGGGSAPAPAPTPEPPPVEPSLSTQCQTGSVARLELPAGAQVGRNAELSLLGCAAGQVFSELRWTQVAGPTLRLMSARSQALTLEPSEPGSYRFEVSFQDAQGRVRSGQAEFNVAAAADTGLLLRGEPSAYSNGPLSVRAWAASLSQDERDTATVNWTVVDGPSTALQESTGWRVLLKAPVVSQDSLLRLRAQVSLTGGRQLSQDFRLLVQAPPRQAASDALFPASDPVSRVYPYLAGGPHAQALKDCIYTPSLDRNNTCTLGRLPLLGQETRGELPTVEQVMRRVLVSNDWMGEAFEAFLREQDSHGDFRRLLNASTAVVIGGRVRPAFYWGATGAIYLDAGYLWLTPEQRDTISETPDPRSDYGAQLRYSAPWRYVLNNAHADGVYPVAERRPRELSRLAYTLGPLLYHELTHAADLVPPRLHTQLSGSLRVWQAGPALTPAADLAQRLPFYSQEMVALGRVQFFGVTATAEQIAYGPEDVARFFSLDRVNDDYSYSMPIGETVSAEDPAMLVEEAMMQLRYGVLRDFAVTTPRPAGGTSTDLIVSWGQRGRIGEPAIRPRVALVLEQIMPWLDAGTTDRLAPPTPLRAGLSWGQNLDQAAIAANRPRVLTARERLIEAEQEQRRGIERARRAQAQALQGGGPRVRQ
ncbi:hypothetical protein [Roseateles toxinivorans]|nr:hypothetical protein [Roseateles toxinivorans]